MTGRNLAAEAAVRGMALADDGIQRGWARLEAGRTHEDDLVVSMIAWHMIAHAEAFARLCEAQKGEE